MNRLANYFLQGLVFLAPIALTLFIFVKIFLVIDGWLRLPVPGLGFVVVLVLVTAFGFLLSNYLAGRLLAYFEGLLDRLPFAKLLHGSVKDMMSSFVGDKRRFDKPVAVELAPGGVRVLGFVTVESLALLGMPGRVGVYLPQAYNFAGQLVLVDRDRIELLTLDSGQLMTFIVSGGLSGRGAAPSIPPVMAPPPAGSPPASELPP